MARPATGKAFYLTIVAGLSLLLAASQPLWERGLAGQNDFVGLYVGGRLSGTADLFSPEAAKKVQLEITEGKAHFPALSFIRPPFYSVLLRPLGQLPYLTAYGIFTAVNLAAFGLFLWLYAREYRETLVLAAYSVPMLLSFINGQDTPLVTAAAGIALWLSVRRRDFLAGLLLSLAAVKFHLFVLVPVALVVHKRWRFLQGGIAGGAALTAIAFLGEGTDWPARMMAALANPQVHPGAGQMTTLRNLVVQVSGDDNRLAEAALSLAVAAFFAFVAGKLADFRAAYGLALVGGLLVSHHAYPHDLLLLLAAAPILKLAECPKPVKALSAIAALPPLSIALFVGPPLSAAAPLLMLAMIGAAALPMTQQEPRQASAGSSAA